MREIEIKAAVLAHIRRAARRHPKPVVTTEFSLGSSGVRADLALLADEFIGIEIKSASDTLRRLRKQLSAYSMHFDKTVLIVADRHVSGIDQAWLNGAALWRVNPDGTVSEIVAAGRSISAIEQTAWTDLLTQEEARRFWGPRSTQPDQVSAAREAFVEAFTRRYKKTSEVFWERVKGRTIKESDLATLSRYTELRLMKQTNLAEREDFWRQWAQQKENTD